MAREKWSEVVSDVKQAELLGRLKQAPEPIKSEIEALKKEAEGKQ